VNSFRLAVLLACAVSLPAADYSTYIGDTYPNSVAAMAVDKSGNTFLAGSRFITAPPDGKASTDVFVTKIDAAGNVTRVATLSGKGSDLANAIAVDGSGNIYVAGATTSPDFPLLNPLQAAPGAFPGGPSAPLETGFLTKLNASGGIVFSTYLGGMSGQSRLNAIALDAQGNAYITGETFAPDYPHTQGLPNAIVSPSSEAVSAAFFAKISAAGDTILYAGGVSATGHECGSGSSCFLSSISTAGVAIALDPSGNAYIGGNTYGLGLPLTAGPADGIGGFVMRVNAAGSGLGYLMTLGSANYFPPPVAPGAAPATLVNSIAADASGNAYVTGWTSDPKFPVTSGTFQSKPSFTVSSVSAVATPPDAFVAKLNPQGTAMVWATFLGGSDRDEGMQIAVGAAKDVWVSGITASSDFPATAGVAEGGEFLTELNPDGTALSFAARFPVNTAAAAMALDATGVIHMAGEGGLAYTLTPAQFSNPRLLGVANAAGGVLSGRIAPSEVISLYGLNFGVKTPVTTAFNSAGLLPTTAGGVQVTINGIAAPLLYVSDTQINAVAPRELTVNASAPLVIIVNGRAIPAFRTEIDRAMPEVFAGALNQDGSLNSAANPAPSGSIVSVWATGLGATPGADGQQAIAAQSCSCSIIITEPSSGVVAAIPPAYAGAAPGLVNGVTQINFPVSAGPAARERVFLTLGIGGPQSDLFTVYVSK
jgi:uncharacterized protein (TIGR03437 family)